MPMILVSLKISVRLSQRRDFLQSLGALLEPTRVAPGCNDCHLYRDVEKEHAYLFMAEWASQSELDRYLASDAGKTLVAAIEMSTELPRVRFDRVTHTGGIEVIEGARSPGIAKF